MPLSADYIHMRCLYCGKELALLKRLTGGGEFCSETHKQSYQEEYNRLALSRLLQAQSKPGDKAAAQKSPARPPEPVRVSAPVAIEEPVQVEEPVMVASHVEEPKIEDAFLPPEAGFSMEMPAFCFLPEGMPYVEPWLESRVELATPKAHFQNGLPALPGAEPLRLEIQPRAWDQTHSNEDNNATPREFNSGKVDLSMPLAVKSSPEIPTAGPVDIEFPPKPPETNRSLSLAGPAGFRFEVLTRSSIFWERPQSVIEYPAEDADVVFPDLWAGFASTTPDVSGPWGDGGQEDAGQPADTPEPDRTPRAALEALSRLHQNMVAEQAADQSADESKSPAAIPVSQTVESEAHETVAVLVGAQGQDIEVSAPVEGQSIPSGSNDLLAIPLKSFPPPEIALAVHADALLTLQQPTLPRMKALPLRPKVALAPAGYTPQPKAPSTPAAKNPVTEAKLRSAASIPIPPRTENRPKPAAPNKPPVQQQKPAQAGPSPQTPKSTPAARPAQPAATAQTQAPAVKPPTPQVQAPSPPAREPIRVPPAKTETPQPRSKPDVQPSPAPDQPTLTFETLHLQLMANDNTSFLATLKGKAAIAAALVVLLGGAAYFMSGKSHKTSANYSDQADSAVGPSIMMGEGGWVQNWGGDPLNAHVGRQITIYRPSLKLSDYRIEFQGQIDTKSLGWVFRAADPNNYYAIKLAIVSPGATPRMALIKYVVRSGRETEVGRVFLNTPARNDTIFSVRTDVRGVKYNTYIQGQPVDVWTDDQLKSGGVGFLNERAERARIKTVSIAYLTGGAR